MKTLEEVKAHLAKEGYNPEDMPRIEGFLFGSGLFEGDEFEIEYMSGNGSFYDFKDWFNGKDEKKSEIDWSEFGFGDFIHVQDGINVVLLGAVCDGELVGFDTNSVRVLLLTHESRPCNESEVEELYGVLRKKGIIFSSGFREFNPTQSSICENEQKVSSEFQELDKSYKELCEIAASMSDDNPFKSVAKLMVESVGKMVDEVKEVEKDDSELIDELEIDSKEAIENLIANIHAGAMNEKEKESVIDALKVLVELGNMYE